MFFLFFFIICLFPNASKLLGQSFDVADWEQPEESLSIIDQAESDSSSSPEPTSQPSEEIGVLEDSEVSLDSMNTENLEQQTQTPPLEESAGGGEVAPKENTPAINNSSSTQQWTPSDTKDVINKVLIGVGFGGGGGGIGGIGSYLLKKRKDQKSQDAADVERQIYGQKKETSQKQVVLAEGETSDHFESTEMLAEHPTNLPDATSSIRRLSENDVEDDDHGKKVSRNKPAKRSVKKVRITPPSSASRARTFKKA